MAILTWYFTYVELLKERINTYTGEELVIAFPLAGEPKGYDVVDVSGDLEGSGSDPEKYGSPVKLLRE